jgi:cytochrome c oxidase subunit IV
MSDQHDSHHVNYLLVFVALCVFTALSVVFDMFQPASKAVLAVLVLGVALAKALCVMAFFMHLKFERSWKYVLLAPTIILACGIPLALLPDIGVHYYTVTAPQQEDRMQDALLAIIDKERKGEIELQSDESIAEMLRNDYNIDVNAAVVARSRGALEIPAAPERKAGSGGE